jgi:sugar transferase (PEP-CTERM system associated)
MPPALARDQPRGLAVLGLIECALSFAVIYAMIGAAGVRAPWTDVFTLLPGDNIALAVVVTFAIGAAAMAIGLYRPDVCLECRRVLAAILLTATVAFAVLLLVGNGIVGNFSLVHSFYMAKVLLAWFATMAMIRLVYSFAMISMPPSRRVLILGDARQVGSVNARLRSRHGRTFDPVVLHEQDVSWPLLRQQSIWGVILAAVPEANTVEALLECKLRGVRVLASTAFHEDYLGRIDLDALTANNLLLARGFATRRSRDTVKRVGDIVLGAAMLILTLPMMALTALAIKIDSPGPVFYRQQRIGVFGKPFTLLKFRSMAADAEANGSPRWAQKKDPRITRVGRFIRTARIDELPQLANVIRGEMSLVGPRPERPHFVERLERAIPFYRQRAYVKPGLTGWAQVNFPYGASVEDAREKLSYDLYYVKNRTLLLDTAILLSTIRVVLFREGGR